MAHKFSHFDGHAKRPTWDRGIANDGQANKTFFEAVSRIILNSYVHKFKIELCL